jgi:protein-S-isoprenylcysteine O-methyltransferase Ste14
LYRVRSPAAAGLMHFIQFCSVLYLLNGARQIGLLKFAGIPNILALITGQSFIPREPEAQGPVLENSNRIKIAGPFRRNRHPLNFGILPIIWLMPRMTVNLAVFNSVTTLYLIFGSLHEEKRLKEAYGMPYVDYQTSGINFLVPGVKSINDSRTKGKLTKLET